MYDYILVGAGSAGCVLARRLTEDPAISVLLLEAGGEDRKRELRIPAAFSKLYRSEVDWDYATEPQERLDQRRVYVPRGKVLGGSSSINAQMVIRGHRADYDGWHARGNPGWSWRELLPYFERSTADAGGPFEITDHRDRNPLTEALVQAAVEAGLPRCNDLNAPEPDGVGYVRVSQRNGRRWSVADGYLHPARRRPNLTVRTGAHATRLLIERRQAVGIAYRQAGHDEEACARREVILCGGAFNSPQLLLLSGIGPRDELAAHGIDQVHELSGVGRNLQDHLAAGVLAATSTGGTLYAAESLGSLARYLLFRRGLLTSNVVEAAAFVRTRPELPPDLELLLAPVLFMDEGLAPPRGHGVSVGAVALHPKSVGWVALRSSDPLDSPLIEPRYLTDPAGDDLRVLVDGVRLARRILAAPAFARHVAEELVPGPGAESDDELAASIRERAQTLYHPVGTCRMGADDEAVVDPELRVHGLERLRVVDASVMPRLPRGHTNWPVVMIAEKAADLVRTAATRV